MFEKLRDFLTDEYQTNDFKGTWAEWVEENMYLVDMLKDYLVSMKDWRVTKNG